MEKNLLWVQTGGTFACKKTEKGLAPATDDKFTAEVIDTFTKGRAVSIIPALLMDKDSTEMNIKDIRKISAFINKNIRKYDGVIITHGTDTMAYTAALLCVMLENPPIPVILTGSQLPFQEEKTDARKNFKDSVTAALCDKLKTVCVVFDGKIYHGLDCYKADSVSPDAFSAYDGVLGEIKEDEVFIKDSKRIKVGEYRYNKDINEKVALIKLTPFFDEGVIDYYISQGIKGLVIEGYGTGGVPARVIKKLKAAEKKGVRSMVITQCKKGGTRLDIYEVGNNVKNSGIMDGKKLGTEGAVAEICRRQISE
ncbi:MAG: asparaginase [Ruminiclostridium sp.]|nr:asparaginase [Ruminiclostridium sp.]